MQRTYQRETRLNSSQIPKAVLFSASTSSATSIQQSSSLQSILPSIYDSSLQAEPSSSPLDLSTTSISPYSFGTFTLSTTPALGAYVTKLTDKSYMYSQSPLLERSSSNLILQHLATSDTRLSSPSNIQQFTRTLVNTPTHQSAVKPTATHPTNVLTSWSASMSTLRFNQRQTTVTRLSVISSSKCSQNGYCCTKGLSQFPSYLQFQENQTPGNYFTYR